jgi:hypothetical protein
LRPVSENGNENDASQITITPDFQELAELCARNIWLPDAGATCSKRSINGARGRRRLRGRPLASGSDLSNLTFVLGGITCCDILEREPRRLPCPLCGVECHRFGPITD